MCTRVHAMSFSFSRRLVDFRGLTWALKDLPGRGFRGLGFRGLGFKGLAV